MDATSTDAYSTDGFTWAASTGTGNGTFAGDCITGTSAGTWGTLPNIAVQKPLKVPTDYSDVPRKYKDKNGCIKKGYWSEPFNITDVAGLSFNTSSDGCIVMGDTDDSAQGNVCLSSASA